MLRPIATPLVLSGFEPATVDLIAGTFRNAGFVPMVTRRRRAIRSQALDGAAA